LTHEVQGRGPQEEEASCLVTGAAPVIDDPAQAFEETRGTMDLINDDELSWLRAQEGIGVFQPTVVGRSFEIEIERPRSMLLGDSARQGGLANLSRAKQDNAGRGTEAVEDDILLATAHYEPRRLNVIRSISGV
jgi:hypothetical protein